nr:cold-shock protein [Beijerinckia indica]
MDALADSPEPAQLVEISGRIKWFDLVKGYGFVVADNGLGDVLLHVTALRKDGHSKACEGARVVCEAMRGTKGWQVFRVISLDAPAPAEKPDLSEEPPRNLSSREEPQVLPLGGFEDVKVKWFNRVKGFGFLSRGDGTEDIFVHMEILRRHGISILHPGEELRARFGQGPKGLIAIEVRPLDAPAPVHH